MPVYQNIFAAVDFGLHSPTVLQKAAAVAELCEAELTVLHVVDYGPNADMDYVLPPIDDREEQLIAAAEARLQELLEREALGSGVGAIVVSGRPKVEIARLVEREHVDLLVVGAHGRHGLAGLLGSTTDRVLRLADCDVLSIR